MTKSTTKAGAKNAPDDFTTGDGTLSDDRLADLLEDVARRLPDAGAFLARTIAAFEPLNVRTAGLISFLAGQLCRAQGDHRDAHVHLERACEALPDSVEVALSRYHLLVQHAESIFDQTDEGTDAEARRPATPRARIPVTCADGCGPHRGGRQGVLRGGDR